MPRGFAGGLEAPDTGLVHFSLDFLIKNVWLMRSKLFQEMNMAIGWAGDGAVQDQIADSLADEVARVRSRLPNGESLLECEECGEAIHPARRKALPGVRLCVACQAERDKEEKAVSPYNRKGSKDSQLR